MLLRYQTQTVEVGQCDHRQVRNPVFKMSEQKSNAYDDSIVIRNKWHIYSLSIKKNHQQHPKGEWKVACSVATYRYLCIDLS